MRKIAIFVDTFEPVTLRKLDIITQIHNSNMFDIIYIIVDDDDNIEAKELLLKCVIKYAIDTKWFNKGLTLGFINCVHTSIVKYIQCIQKEYDITIIIDDNLNGYYQELVKMLSVKTIYMNSKYKSTICDLDKIITDDNINCVIKL